MVFDSDLKNITILLSRVQLCDKAFKTAMSLAFTSNYMDESGNFLQKQYTADILSAMSEINKRAGRDEGMAAMAATAAKAATATGTTADDFMNV